MPKSLLAKHLTVSPPVKKLFDEYEKAFRALDIAKSASFCADTFITAGLNGIITTSKAEVLAATGKAAEFYRSIGQKSAKILSLDEQSITEL